MPVKVRCPSCEKLLNAPDAARGKAIKCPACDTKIRVPAESAERGTGGGRAAVKATAKSKASQDSMEILANLDLSKAIDSSASMCPKCGADIPEGATECPKCGVDPTTGQLSDSAKKRAGRKGPDPALFYATAWKDAWGFTTGNIRMVWRTIWYACLWYGIAGGCAFMSNWSTRLPPKAFWFALTLVALQVFPGWLWFLTVETVKTTVSKKSKITDRNFDIFQNVALGIKTILWSFVFGWMPLSMLMYPLAMIHMSMPVTIKAWKWWTMLAIFFRNFGPTMYFWLMAIVMGLPNTLVIGAIAALFGNEFLTMVRASNEGSPVTFRWPVLVAVGIIGLLGLFWFVFSSIFMMRVIGLIGYYFRDTLDLVVVVEEKAYVRKEVKLDAFGQPIKSRGQRFVQAAVPIVALVIIGFVFYFIYYQIWGKTG